MPKRVFISYRHTRPDENIATILVKHFEMQGFKVFFDKRIKKGTRWAQEIDRQIRSARYFVVLISHESIHSDMVRKEVQLAHELSQDPNHLLTILPVRINFTDSLPYDLGAWLEPYQYVLWKRGQAYKKVALELATAIDSPVTHDMGNKSTEIQVIPEESESAASNLKPPLPVADIRMDTGAMPESAPLYVERQADAQVLRLVQQNGVTIVLKGSRQMGKSSLLYRAYHVARSAKKRVCLIDFQLMDTHHLRDLNTLSRYIAEKLARDFQTAAKPEQFWNDRLGPKDSLTDFMDQAVLSEDRPSPVLLLDEADRVFAYDYRTDFFGLIRAWHDRRALEQRWASVNIVIAHSTEPYLWIQNNNQSPFNVGGKIVLEDFTIDHLKDLNTKHGSPLKTQDDFVRLQSLVSGQPYLVRQALYEMAVRQWDLDALEHNSRSERGPFGDHLRQLLWGLRDRQKLRSALKEVLRRRRCRDEDSFYRLASAGLIQGNKPDAVTMRCQLYAKFFQDVL